MGISNTHWYAGERTASLCPGQRVGESVHQILENEQWRDVEGYDDVIEYGLAPGCTSVCGMLSKPGLNIWMQNIMAEESYMMAQRGEHQNMDARAWRGALLAAKDSIGKRAADEGSVIHGVIEDAILTNRLHLSDDPNVVQVAGLVNQMIADYSHLGYKFVEMVAEKSFVFNDVITFGGRTDLLMEFVEAKTNKRMLVVVDFKTRDFGYRDVQNAIRGLQRGNKTFGRLTPRDTEPMQIAANLVGHGGGRARGEEEDVRIEGGNLYLSRTEPGASWYYPYSQEQLVNGWLSFQAAQMLYRNTVLGGRAQKTEVNK